MLRALPTFSNTGAEEHWQRAPFTITIGSTIWSAATDGKMLFAVKSPSKYEKLDDHFYRIVARLFVPAPDKAKETTLEHLRGFTGGVPDLREFDVDGRDDGVIFSVVVDKRRLACLLEPLTVNTVSVWDSTKRFDVRSVTVDAPGWRTVLAGIDLDPAEDDDHFEFQERGMSSFDAAMARLEED